MMETQDQMPESENTPEQADEQVGQLDNADFYVPGDLVEGKDCQPGDTITLEVSGEPDDDGDVPVKIKSYSHKGGKSMNEDYAADGDLQKAFGKQSED